MTECESRVQAFAVAMREEAFTGGITERARKTLEALLEELIPRAQSATVQGCQSILVRIRTNVDSLAKGGEIRDAAAVRLRELTEALNPPGATPFPQETGGGGPGGILKTGALRLSPMMLVGLAGMAAAAYWFFIRRRKRH